MSRHAAVLGLGTRGYGWTALFRAAGWQVTGFDPESAVTSEGVARETTISATVRRAHWIAICLPERLELLQKVLQRAQAEAPRDAVFGVVSARFAIDDVQGCALRPESVILVQAKPDGGFAFDVSSKTGPKTRAAAERVLAELAAHASLTSGTPRPSSRDAQSA
ncbi:MAG: hypothetical protein AAF368_14535 [Planctomycetota bacterium]